MVTIILTFQAAGVRAGKMLFLHTSVTVPSLGHPGQLESLPCWQPAQVAVHLVASLNFHSNQRAIN